MVASARAVGVQEDFHIWTDAEEVPGARVHAAGEFDPWGWLFKLVFLREQAAKLPYDYLVFLDTDHWFVRHPGDIAGRFSDVPMHITLEADLTREEGFLYWWEYPTLWFVDSMRKAGVTTPGVYAVNAGMFVVRRDAAEEVYRLADQFWGHCKRRGAIYVDEPLLSYAMHRLCSDVSRHTLEATGDFWATDLDGLYQNTLPEDRPFDFRGLYRGNSVRVRPAIVHAIRSKRLLMNHARTISADALNLKTAIALNPPD